MTYKNLLNSREIFLSDNIIYTYSDKSLFSLPLVKEDSENTEDKTQIKDLELQTATMLGFNNKILSFINDKKLNILHLKTSKKLISENLPYEATSIYVSPSGMNTVIGYDNGIISIHNNLSNKISKNFNIFKDKTPIENIIFYKDNIIIASNRDNIIILDLLQNIVLSKVATPNLESLYMDNEKIFYTSYNNEIFLIDLNNILIPKKEKIDTFDKKIISVKTIKNTNLIYVSTSSIIFTIDLVTKDKQVIYNNYEEIYSIELDSENGIYIAHTDGVDFIKYSLDKKNTNNSNSSSEIQEKEDVINFLTVDDSTTIRLIIKKSILNNFTNVTVAEATDGVEALSYLKANPKTDVVFLDWNMPNMNGDEVINEIAKRPELKHLKIIMATTEGSKDKVKIMIAKGVTGYLIKPLKATSVNPLTQKIIEIIKKERLNNV